jgi:NAD-dependent DNA ligase
MTLSEIYIALSNKDFKSVTEEVKKLNKAYRDGKPEITDSEYDRLIDTIKLVDPENEIFNSGVIETVEVNSDRKETLRYPMFSLDKETTIEEIHKWLVNKGVPITIDVVITAKYDGISILKNEFTGEAWSRGDGVEGETMHEHYKKLGDTASKIELYTIGEMIIPKPVFASHAFYRESGEPFKNARNMIAGLKNSDTISEDLKYAKHVRYGFANEDYTLNKSRQLETINHYLAPLPFKVLKANELTVEGLDELYFEWGKEYDIDGLVIDIDDKDIRKSLGRERNNNPAYARAYKKGWTPPTSTNYRGIEWNLSKTKAIKPVVLLEPFDIEGVTVSRVTGYNAKFIKDNQIGAGATLEVIRSGSVIPKIVGVSKIGLISIPTHCPSCGSELFWNENEVDLICTNKNCGEINFQKVVFFFVRFKITGFAEKTIKKFYDAGYDTVGKILSMSFSDIQKIEGMGNLSATKLLKEFDTKIKQVPFEIIGHASGCFENIGSRKLKMIVDGIKDVFIKHEGSEHFDAFKKAIEKMDLNLIKNILEFEVSYNQIVKHLNTIKGMSDKTSENFLDGLICFTNFMEDLNITITDKPVVEEVKVEEKNNDTNMKKVDLTGREFVFTGFRDAELKSFIESCGGQVKDGITKKTTDLLTKNADSTSTKAKKAKEVGANVTQVDDFKNSLK